MSEPLTVSIKSGKHPCFDSVVRLSNGTDLTKLGITKIEVDIEVSEIPTATITLVRFEHLDLEGLRLALPMESLVSLAAAHGLDVVAKRPLCGHWWDGLICDEPSGHQGPHAGGSPDDSSIGVGVWAPDAGSEGDS